MMSFLTRTPALIGTGVLLAAPLILIAAPAHADVERHGSCGGGHHEFAVDREAGGFEVSVDLDHVKPGTEWQVVLRHDGKRFLKRTLVVDREGEIEVERWHANSAGQDTFKFRATRANGSATCSAKIVVA
jgi:hypothetical protein